MQYDVHTKGCSSAQSTSSSPTYRFEAESSSLVMATQELGPSAWTEPVNL